MIGRIIPHPHNQEVHVQIPHACEYAVSHGDRQFQLQIEISLLNHPTLK